MNFLLIFLFMAAITFFGAIGSLFFKLALNSSKRVVCVVFSKFFYFGVLFFLLGFISYLFILKENNVSFLFPLTSLTYVWSTMFAHIFLKERVNVFKILAIIFIIIGVIFING